MRVNPSYPAESRGMRALRNIIAGELGWFFAANPMPDYGIDAVAEVVIDGVVTGQWLAIQSKGGRSHLRPTDGGWTFEKAEGNPTKLAEPSEPDDTGADQCREMGAENRDDAVIAARGLGWLL